MNKESNKTREKIGPWERDDKKETNRSNKIKYERRKEQRKPQSEGTRKVNPTTKQCKEKTNRMEEAEYRQNIGRYQRLVRVI